MAHLAPGELKRFNADPIGTIDYDFDIDYVGDGIPEHRLDVMRPRNPSAPLPVYVYFHGGAGPQATKHR